jgi:hypothetical protein
VQTFRVVGGGYAGFYTAWKPEKKLRRDEAEEPEPAVTEPEPIDAGTTGVTARELVPTEHVRSA